MHAQQVVAILQSLHVYRIVQILRIFAVDRDDAFVRANPDGLAESPLPLSHPEPLPPPPARPPETASGNPCLRMIAQNIDAGIVLMPENFDHFAFRQRPPFRILHDVDDDLLPGTAPLNASCGMKISLLIRLSSGMTKP